MTAKTITRRAAGNAPELKPGQAAAIVAAAEAARNAGGSKGGAARHRNVVQPVRFLGTGERGPGQTQRGSGLETRTTKNRLDATFGFPPF